MIRRQTPPLAGLFALQLSLAIPLAAQVPVTRGLLPVPRGVEWRQGQLPLDTTFRIALVRSDPRLNAAAGRFLDRLVRRTGVPLSHLVGHDSASATLLIDARRTGTAVPALEEDESYTLDVSRRGVALHSATTVGSLRGLETLLQLVESGEHAGRCRRFTSRTRRGSGGGDCCSMWGGTSSRSMSSSEISTAWPWSS